MLKKGEMEDSEIRDSATGLNVRISTTVRLVFRKLYPEEYGKMRNARLNAIIANDFIKNSGNVRHYFRLGGKEEGERGDPAEIRAGSVASMFYISAIRERNIDVLTTQSDWFRPKYKVLVPDESGIV